jgi:hypothetical protein
MHAVDAPGFEKSLKRLLGRLLARLEDTEREAPAFLDQGETRDIS